MTGSFTIKRAMPERRTELDYYDSLTNKQTQGPDGEEGRDKDEVGGVRGGQNQRLILASLLTNSITIEWPRCVSTNPNTTTVTLTLNDGFVRRWTTRVLSCRRRFRDKTIPLGLAGKDVVASRRQGQGRRRPFSYPSLTNFFVVAFVKP